ncbi:MAG: glycosyltransferase family 4 protein [Anaerolineales bacterium]|nr:glycosyltransferase family 4 protein [Anaerolineales bacterium]
MHVAVNGYFWQRPFVGSGQYTRNLVYFLNRLVSDLEITLVVPQFPGEPEPEDVPPSVRLVKVPARPGHLGKVWFEQRQFPAACREAGATIVHVPYWGGPLQSPAPLVVTVHDLTTLLVPEYQRGAKARLYNALVSASARGADHIITDSMFSKDEIVVHLGIEEEKITAVPLAVGPQYTAQENSLVDMAVLRKYNLPDFYVLYLGGYEVHKNVTTLLLAWTYVSQALGQEYPLVLAGRKPQEPTAVYPDYDDYIHTLQIAEYVRWIGFVDEADKPVLYRNAETFVFPSRREGFGLPVLEAMACGVPVVTSSSTSLPEIVGDAGFTVDPDDARGMAGAIIATVVQENLAAELRQKGQQQAAHFSWKKTATETLLVYDRVLSGI